MNCAFSTLFGKAILPDLAASWSGCMKFSCLPLVGIREDHGFLGRHRHMNCFVGRSFVGEAFTFYLLPFLLLTSPCNCYYLINVFNFIENLTCYLSLHCVNKCTI